MSDMVQNMQALNSSVVKVSLFVFASVFVFLLVAGRFAFFLLSEILQPAIFQI